MSSYNPSSLDADMDNFLDYSGGNLNSPTAAMDPMSAMMSTEHADERQVLSGPSHEYGRFKQQTGLPAGAMSSMNAFGDMAGDNDFMSQPTFAQPNSQTQNFVSMDLGGYGSGVGFDMDYETSPNSALPTMFFQGAGPDINDFAGPSGLAPPYNTGAGSQTRLWPGMHSQQAEQARAEANARQQRQQLQGQQIMQQRQREQSISSQMSSGSRKSRAPSQSGVDTVADERISRILDTMRHNSTVSTIDEESNSLDDNAARSAKMRKDEEEMDEDERLLASEEGKKLSSKERRQLRNKVSARAFRSRRKEYISQLEGEVAAKANECTELKNQNRKLTDENGQLKHLTRTLLSHPAFQTFLEDISRDPSVIAPFQGSIQSARNMSNTEEQNQSQYSNDQDSTPTSDETQVNVAEMPNNSEYSMMSFGNPNWGPTHSNFNFQQPQVFAVTEVPEAPVFEEITIPRIPSLKASSERFSTASGKFGRFSAKLPILSLSHAPRSNDYGTTDSCLSPSSEHSHRSATLDRKDHLNSTQNTHRSNSSITHFDEPICSEPESLTYLTQEIDELFDTVDSSVQKIDKLTSHLPRP